MPPHTPPQLAVCPRHQGRAVAFAQTARGGRPLDKTPKPFPSQVPAVAAAAIWKRSMLETRTHLFKHGGDPSEWICVCATGQLGSDEDPAKRAQQRCGGRAPAEWPAYDAANCPATMPHRRHGAELAWHGRTRMVQPAKSGSAGHHTILGTAREASVVFCGLACPLACSMS